MTVDPLDGPEQGDSFDDSEQRASLDLGSVFANALDGLLSVTGAQLVAGITLAGFASAVLMNSLFVQLVERALAAIRNDLAESDPAVRDALQDPEVQEAIQEIERAVESTGLTVDIPIPAILVALLALALVVEAIKIVAARAFADDALDGVPGSLAKRRLATATLSGFVVGLLLKIVITLTAGLTFFLLAIPALFIFIGTMLYRQEIAIADKGPLGAISGSWALVKGNRWDMLIVAVVLFVIGIVIWLVTMPVAGTAGIGIAALLGGLEVTFGVAVVTEAYVQLRGAPAGEQPAI